MTDHDRDPDAFQALYRDHYRQVCRFLALRTTPDHVEDVAAEVFLIAWRRFGEITGPPLPWLFGVAHRAVANDRRSGRRAVALTERVGAVAAAESSPPLAEPADEALARDGTRRALLEALDRLAPRDRELLLLTHWHGLAPRDVATVLDLTPVLVRTRLSRANRRLRRELAQTLQDRGLRPPQTTTRKTNPQEATVNV